VLLTPIKKVGTHFEIHPHVKANLKQYATEHGFAWKEYIEELTTEAHEKNFPKEHKRIFRTG
jgi:hypothetical protein